MLSHIPGLTASPQARYTLKWEEQIPGRSFENHQKPHLPTNKQITVERIYVGRSRSWLAVR